MVPHGLPTVDLIIPALNEEANMQCLLATLPWPQLRHVIVADNGSTDRTADLARAGGAQIVLEPRRGYGAACSAALDWICRRAPSPDLVAFLDADLADDPGQLPRLIRLIDKDEADLAIGSRRRQAEPGAMTAAQWIGNTLACTLLRLSTGVRFTDLGPLRAIRWSSLQALAMKDRTWGWTIEMQYKAARQGLRCVEIEVPYRRRLAGRSKISGSIVGATRAGWCIITTIVRLWWDDSGWPRGRSNGGSSGRHRTGGGRE